MLQPSRRADRPEAPATDETARFEGVDFGYADAPAVLREVSLTLPRGSFHFLTGPSGAGKSSLLKLLTLAERPSAGRLSMFGEDVTAVGRRDIPLLRRRIGVVFQDFRLLDHLSAFDNAALSLRLTGRQQPGWIDDVTEMLKWVGLGDLMDVLPTRLSGGEKQRLAIARAVMGKPDLLIADEPTGNVDSAMATRLLKLFQSLNRMGTTILIATHDEALAARSGARILRLAQGRVEAVA